jgi:hypothetical protein
MPISETRKLCRRDDRELGGGRPGDHVAGVLLVAGGVGDDELALLGGEEPVGDVDRDALFPLRGQPVDEQREVQLAALGTVLGVCLQRLEVVLEHEVRLVEHPPDQRGLAVVHAAAGDEPQHGLVLVSVQVGLDVPGDEVRGSGHQK